MICLLVSPGVKILPNDVALLLSKCRYHPNGQIPQLISSIEFDPDDPAKLSTFKTVSEQCRHTIIQIPLNQADHKGKDLETVLHISIVWICEGEVRLDSADGIAIASLFQFACSRFQLKAMILLTTTDDKYPKELSLFCFAQPYNLNQLQEMNFCAKYFVASGCIGDSPFACFGRKQPSSPTVPLDLIANSSDWNVTVKKTIDKSLISPSWMMTNSFDLQLQENHPLEYGIFAVQIDEHYGGILIIDSKMPIISVISAEFTKLFFHVVETQTCKENVPVTQPARVKTPPLTKTPNQIPLRPSNSFVDTTISLSGWTAGQVSQNRISQSQSFTLDKGADDIKAKNKEMLKKLLLLSLRHVGIDKNSPDFISTWKHLYCGCLFALRKDLAHEIVDQGTMLSVIKNNINFLNISR